jgi:predicted nuclease with TOPRIM domain
MTLVEERLEEHSDVIDGLRESVVSLGERVTSVGERVGSLERRVDRLEERMDHGFARVDQGFARIDQRFDLFEARMAKQFHWLVGILVTSMVAMVGVLGGLVAAVVR